MAIGHCLSLLDHLWSAFNNSANVQAKVAQMTEDEKNQHAALIYQAMHGPHNQAALDQLRKLASE